MGKFNVQRDPLTCGTRRAGVHRASPAPAVIVDRAVLEVAADLFNRRNAPNGIIERPVRELRRGPGRRCADRPGPDAGGVQDPLPVGEPVVTTPRRDRSGGRSPPPSRPRGSRRRSTSQERVTAAGARSWSLGTPYLPAARRERPLRTTGPRPWRSSWSGRRAPNKRTAEWIDQSILTVIDALDDWDITEVSQPSQVSAQRTRPTWALSYRIRADSPSGLIEKGAHVAKYKGKDLSPHVRDAEVNLEATSVVLESTRRPTPTL